MIKAAKVDEIKISSGAQAILIAAEKLFSMKGYELVSINEIANEAGLSKANIFHHFSNKETLYFEVLKKACEVTAENMLKLHVSKGTFEKRITSFMNAHLNSLFDNEQSTLLVLREVQNNGSKRARSLAQNVFGSIFHQFVNILSIAQQNGELKKKIDPALVATLLLSSNINFFQNQSVLKHMPRVEFSENIDLYVKQSMDIFLNGISNDS